MNIGKITKQFTRREDTRKMTSLIDFKFGKVYTDLVENIDTTDIADDCILFSSNQANIFNEEFSKKSYWSNPEETKNKYWFFATNGEGDYWLSNEEREVFFFDHDSGDFAEEKFIPLGINFEQWLSAACSEEIPCLTNYTEALNKIHTAIEEEEEFKIVDEPKIDLGLGE